MGERGIEYSLSVSHINSLDWHSVSFFDAFAENDLRTSFFILR